MLNIAVEFPQNSYAFLGRGQQDVGQEGVATRHGVLSLRSFALLRKASDCFCNAALASKHEGRCNENQQYSLTEPYFKEKLC